MAKPMPDTAGIPALFGRKGASHRRTPFIQARIISRSAPSNPEARLHPGLRLPLLHTGWIPQRINGYTKSSFQPLNLPVQSNAIPLHSLSVNRRDHRGDECLCGLITGMTADQTLVSTCRLGAAHLAVFRLFQAGLDH